MRDGVTLSAVAADPIRAHVRALPPEWTPLRALAAVETLPHTVFFESGGDMTESSDWTILAWDPAWRLEISGGALHRVEAGSTRRLQGDPLEALRSAWPPSVEVSGAPPVPFVSGFAGFVGYDVKDWIERYPSRARRESTLPDASLGYYDVVWAWRRSTGEGWVVATGLGAQDARRRAERGRNGLDEQWNRIASTMGSPPPAEDAIRGIPRVARTLESNFTRASYCRMVETALDHIAAGDIYQVNLAQRFRVTPSPSVSTIYRSLRCVAPAPFLALLTSAEPGTGIASSSPERFFRIEGRRIETWPIKGTRPRGQSAAADAALAAELLRSQKDRAENVMIVDLERNDLGRVCEIGSVRVPALCEISSHANVHHLVSRVEGRLRSDAGPVDVLRALMPGGSITGAPKIRSVEIIDALEPVRRGVYTGAIGYWDARGNCDWNIAIRTIVAEGGAATFHAGGGIVADSTPEGEYEETLVKAGGMMRALGVDVATLRS